VAQEGVTETFAIRSAFDQSRDVGEHESSVVYLDDTQIRLEGCEWIVGNLRLGCRHPRHESALSGVRKADERRISEQLEFEDQVTLLAVFTLLGEVGSDIGSTHQGNIALPSAATGQDGDAQTRLGEIGDDRPVGLTHDRPDRHGKHHVRSRSAVLEFTTAIRSIAGSAVGPSLIIEKGADGFESFNDDAPSCATRTTLGAPTRLSAPALERRDPGSTITGAKVSSITLTSRRPRREP